jgi:hypothetical protein
VASDAPATDDGLSAFERARPRLLGIACRMLGSAADAEDVVQDIWTRWQSTDRRDMNAVAGNAVGEQTGRRCQCGFAGYVVPAGEVDHAMVLRQQMQAHAFRFAPTSRRAFFRRPPGGGVGAMIPPHDTTMTGRRVEPPRPPRSVG